MFFSIITCTYNSEKFIQKNIASVGEQNFKDYEHIFIDGFSSDNTLNNIKEYQNKNLNQIKLFQIKAAGISNAMNQGIKHAQGKYLIHLHSDDSFYDKNVLTEVKKFLEINNYPDWIYGKANIIEENGKKFAIFPHRKIMQLGNAFLGKNVLKYVNYIPHQATFIKKDCFLKYGLFDESLTSAMDSEMWLRIKNKTKWIFFDRIVCNYTIGASAQSSSKNKQQENINNYQSVQKKYLNYLELNFAKIINYIKKKHNKTLR